MKKTFISFLAVAIIATLFSTSLFAAPTDPNFTTQNVFDGGDTTKIDFDHAGRMYMAQKRGRLMRALPNGTGGFQTLVEMLNIQSQVDSESEGSLQAQTRGYLTNQAVVTSINTSAWLSGTAFRGRDVLPGSSIPPLGVNNRTMSDALAITTSAFPPRLEDAVSP